MTTVAFIHSTAWTRIQKQLKQDRDDYLNQLVNHQPEYDTAILRGRIQMIDEILERYPTECSQSGEAHEELTDD